MWVQCFPLAHSRGLIFSPENSTKFIIRVNNSNPNWDFAGWFYYLAEEVGLGEVTGSWQRIYLRNNQKLLIDPRLIDSEYSVIFNPVDWLIDYTIAFYRWEPVEQLTSADYVLQPNETIEFAANPKRKDYYLANNSNFDVAYFWGNSGTYITLASGNWISGANEWRKLTIKNISDSEASVYVMERFEE